MSPYRWLFCYNNLMVKRISSRVLGSLKRLTGSSSHPNKIVIIDQLSILTHDKPEVIDTWRLPHTSATALRETTARSTIEQATPLDVALHAYGDPASATKHRPVHTISLHPASHISGTVWHHGSSYNLYVKGAPEKILHRCDLTENERELAHITLHKLSSGGDTVIAFAHSTRSTPITDASDIQPSSLTFDGFIVLSHPVVIKAKQAITKLIASNVNIILITGSHVETAYSIARSVGIVSSRQQVFDSRHLHTVADASSDETLYNIRVFARADDETKQAITQLFKNSKPSIISSSSDLYAL